MNGVHDMGGMQDFGPVAPEADEPRFHYPWERRAFALQLAMGATGAWSLDQARSARESLPPAQYLASSYYEIWFAGLVALMRERGLVSAAEIASGRKHEPPKALPRRLDGNSVAAALARGASTQRPLPGTPRFAPGDAVRTVNVNPPGHTRLPRYCRGKPGTIVAIHGAHVYPDANARGGGENPHWLYTVRFAASELWGPDTSATTVHVDCFEPYLEAR
jgi:nitrile hydratase